MIARVLSKPLGFPDNEEGMYQFVVSSKKNKRIMALKSQYGKHGDELIVALYQMYLSR